VEREYKKRMSQALLLYPKTEIFPACTIFEEEFPL
jgi:hypothetical protein